MAAGLSLPSPRAFFAFLITERLSTTISEPGTDYRKRGGRSKEVIVKRLTVKFSLFSSQKFAMPYCQYCFMGSHVTCHVAHGVYLLSLRELKNGKNRNGKKSTKEKPKPFETLL